MKTTPRIISALAIAGAFVTTAVQAAESGPYIRLENGFQSISGAKYKVGGVEIGKVKFDESYIYGGALGYSFGAFATELEIDNTNSKIKALNGVSVTDTKLNQTTFLLNGVYKIDLSEAAAVKLSGGLGLQVTDFSAPSVAGASYKTDSAFAAQLSPSVSFNLTKNCSLSAGYKLRFVDESQMGSFVALPVNLTSHWDHVFTVGVGFSF